MEHPFIINSRGKCQVDDRGFLSKYFSTSTGRATLAAAMIAPIRRNLDYAGIARRCLIIEPLIDGALSTYDKEPK